MWPPEFGVPQAIGLQPVQAGYFQQWGQQTVIPEGYPAPPMGYPAHPWYYPTFPDGRQTAPLTPMQPTYGYQWAGQAAPAYPQAGPAQGTNETVEKENPQQPRRKSTADSPEQTQTEEERVRATIASYLAGAKTAEAQL